MNRKHKRDKKENILEKDYKNIIDFANYIFGQIKLQQEVRDRWFGHYLAIVGGVATFSAFTLTFLQDIIKIELLRIILGLVFTLTGLLGFVFYFLYLSQRINYRLHYRVLEEIQNLLINAYLKNPYEFYYPTSRSPFKRLKHGADYYSSLVQNIIVSVCFFVSCYFFLRDIAIISKYIIIICFTIFLISIIILRFIYRKFENAI